MAFEHKYLAEPPNALNKGHVNLLINQVFFPTFLKVLESGFPQCSDVAHRFIRLDSVQGAFMLQQMLDLFQWELLRIPTIKGFGDDEPEVHDVAGIPVGQVDMDTSAKFTLVNAITWSELNGHE